MKKIVETDHNIELTKELLETSNSKSFCNDGLCAELSLMVDVFNSCIETRTLPGKGSPCQEKIIELLNKCGKKPTALKVRGA